MTQVVFLRPYRVAIMRRASPDSVLPVFLRVASVFLRRTPSDLAFRPLLTSVLRSSGLGGDPACYLME